MTSSNPSNPGDFPFVPGKLISHFDSRPVESQAEGWTALWDTEQNDLWDRGKPSPALIDFLEGGGAGVPDDGGKGEGEGVKFLSGFPTVDGEKGNGKGRLPRALVPGCGKGYDVVMLALHGFDVYGLEVSAKGVETAKQYAERELKEVRAFNFGGDEAREKCLKGGWKSGKVEIVQGDFFSREWEEELGKGGLEAEAHGGEKGFDLIYDYTFLCALLPEMRRDWARRMSELLAPGGVLVCLEFPLYKDLKHPGPPWPLREGIYWDLLACGGDGVFESEEEVQRAMEKESHGKMERVARLTPSRSHGVSKGTDRLSVWRLKRV